MSKFVDDSALVCNTIIFLALFREVYTEVLKIAMCVSHLDSSTHHSAAIVELLKLMCEDHGKAAGLEGMYSGAFFIASDESQLDTVWKRLNEIGVDFTKEWVAC